MAEGGWIDVCSKKKSKQTERQQQPSGSWRRTDPQLIPPRPHAGRAGRSVSPSTSSWAGALRGCEGSTEQVRNACESGSRAEADMSTVKESSCMFGPPIHATKPRSHGLENSTYTIHDPFEMSNVDFSRRAMDTVADGLWYFVTSRLWEHCQSDKQFVEQYISSKQDDTRYFHVSAVDYQKLTTARSPESEDILKTVQQCGRPDAYNLLRICRNEGLGRSLNEAAQSALDGLFHERNEMAHGNHLSVNSVSRKKENVSEVIENGCTLLQAVTQWASRRPDGLAKIERCAIDIRWQFLIGFWLRTCGRSYHSLIGIQTTFQEFNQYRSRRTWVEKTRAKGLTDDATVIEVWLCLHCALVGLEHAVADGNEHIEARVGCT